MGLVTKISAAILLSGFLVTTAFAIEPLTNKPNNIKNNFGALSVSFINYTYDDYNTSAYYPYPNTTIFKTLNASSKISYPTMLSDLVCLNMERISDNYKQDLGCYDHSVVVEVKPSPATKNDNKRFTVEIK